MRRLRVINQISEIMRRFPENLALDTPHGSWDYAMLESRTRGLQLSLAEQGIPVNGRIGVLTGDHPLCYSSICAILASGCAFVPLSHRSPEDRLLSVIEDAGLELVISHRPYEPLGAAVTSASQCSLVRSDEIDAVSGAIDLPESDPDSLVYLLYTSGSTGKPKGVPIYHRNIEAFLGVMLDEERYAFSPADRFLQMFDLTFDASVPAYFIPFCTGASTFVIPEDGIASLNVIRSLQDNKISVAFMVPSVLFYVQRYFAEIQVPKLRYSLFVGEALPESIAMAWRICAPQARLQNLYGPTEATVVCFLFELSESLSPSDVDNGIISIGRPFPNMQAFVVDEHGVEVSVGERGELCIAGSQVTDQYWQDEEKTAAAFFRYDNQPAYRTGDICYVNDRDNFVYCGRRDHQVKIDGYRVELGEIEHHARVAAKGANAAVIASLTADGSVSLTLFLENPPVDDSEIMGYLSRKLPAYMLPKRITALADLPLNVNGKIDRGALAGRANAA